MKVGDEQNCGNCAFYGPESTEGGTHHKCWRYPTPISVSWYHWCGEHTLTGLISRQISKGDYFHATGKDPE